MINTLFFIVLSVCTFTVALSAARGSQTYWLLPNVALATFYLLYVVPLASTDTTDEVFFGIVICNLTFLASIVFFRSRPAPEGQPPPPINSAGNILPLYGALLCTIGVFAAYLSLRSAGGLLGVLNAAGGSGYLEARVHGNNSGLLGVAIWAASLGLAIIFAVWLDNTRRKFVLLLFITYFVLCFGVYFLLTVRHNTVASILMLAVVYFRFKGLSIRSTLPVGAAILAVVVSFQSVRQQGIEDFSLVETREITNSSFEHIEITELMVERANALGYLWFEHGLDSVVFLVPRAIWPGKPSTSTLNRTFFPEEARGGTEKAPGIVAEGMVSLGYLGLILLTTALVGFLSIIQRRLDRHKNAFSAALLAAAFVPYCYISVRTGVLGKHLITFIFLFILYLAIPRLIKKRARILPVTT